MRTEMQNIAEAVGKSLKLIGQRMDWETAPHRLEEINAMIEAGDIWSDPARAQKMMRDRQALTDAIERLDRLYWNELATCSTFSVRPKSCSTRLASSWADWSWCSSVINC